jgi:hypothetical protein
MALPEEEGPTECDMYLEDFTEGEPLKQLLYEHSRMHSEGTAAEKPRFRCEV